MVSARERLKRWRTQQDLSLAEVGKLLGCDGSLIGHIENGRRSPGRRTANRIAAATAEWDDGPILSTDWDRDDDQTEAA